MSKRFQVHLSAVVLAAMILLMSGFLALTFYVPHLTALWSSQERPLTHAERVVAALSRVAQVHGLPLFSILTLMLSAGLVWRIAAQVQLRHSFVRQQ